MDSRIESPGDMRRAVAGYVATVHRAYLSATARLEPAVARELPLLAAGEFTVLAVAAGMGLGTTAPELSLHLIATSQVLAPVTGPEVEAADDVGGLRWRVRFYDPVVVPALGAVKTRGTDAGHDVRQILGLEHWLYHLVATPSAGLSAHNAFHAGAALAAGHVRGVLATVVERS